METHSEQEKFLEWDGQTETRQTQGEKASENSPQANEDYCQRRKPDRACRDPWEITLSRQGETWFQSDRFGKSGSNAQKDWS